MVWCNLSFENLWGHWVSVALWVPRVRAFCCVGEVAVGSICAVASGAVVEALNVFSFHKVAVVGIPESGLIS